MAFSWRGSPTPPKLEMFHREEVTEDKSRLLYREESELERGGGGGCNYPPICRYKFGEITWPRGMKFPGRRSVDGFVGGAIMWLCTKMKRGRSEAE